MTLEGTLNRCFKHKVIPNCDGDPYLHRWYIFRTERVALFLHKFIRSDEDRALHDHPWAFLVIPIWRGYWEHSQKGKRRVLPIIGTRLRPATYRHRVELLSYMFCAGTGEWEQYTKIELPAWSLFFRFTRIRDWGFWANNGFIKWNIWGRIHKCVDE